MVKILHAPLALSDLQNIWSYIARDNPAAADKLLERIDASFRLIAETPDLGFEIESIRPGLRCKPVRRNYLIFYEISGETVTILRILHAARQHDELM